MTKITHQLYLLLPLVFILWWSITIGFNPYSKNKATYESMSGGVSYSSITTNKDNPTVANNQSNQKEEQKSKGLTPDIGFFI